MAVSTFQQTNANTQVVNTYMANVDANFSVMSRIADAFAPHAQATPDMSIGLDAGYLYNGHEPIEIAAQNAGPLTSPSSNPRIDRVVVDMLTGIASVVTGVEAATPTPPTIPAGKAPVAQVLLQVGTQAITNAMITDERCISSGGSSQQRTSLTADTTFYVSTTGSDSNSGLSAAAPLATIQRAIDIIATQYDLCGYSVTIQLADGTYTSGFTVNKPWVGGAATSVVINGNSSTPSNVLVSASPQYGVAYADGVGCGFSIRNLKLQAASGSCLYARNMSQIVFSNIVFGSAAVNHIMANLNSLVTTSSNYAISGSALGHIGCTGRSVFSAANIVVTLSGTPAFQNGFAWVSNAGYIGFATSSFSGAATGYRYYSALNSVISTSGGGANYFPGSLAGSVATGGQYA